MAAMNKLAPFLWFNDDTMSKRTAKRAGYCFFIARNCDGGYLAWVSQVNRGDSVRC